jgi:hypothetical protein
MNRLRLSHPIAGALLAAAVMLGSAPLHAQATDSTSFRAGQWGAEFTVNGNALGILRFSSPTSAWIGQLRGSWESTDAGNDPRPFVQDLNVRAIEVQFGKRWYRPLVGDVLQHVTLGALASNARQERRLNDNTGEVQGTNAVGLFVDVGAQWMVTKNLSLGAQYGLGARVSRAKIDEASPEITITNTLLTLGPVGIRAALFF